MGMINPLSGGSAGLPLPIKPATPTGTGLARAVVLERDHGRKNHQKNGEQLDDDAKSDGSQREYPVYDPHATIENPKHPDALDVVA